MRYFLLSRFLPIYCPFIDIASCVALGGGLQFLARDSMLSALYAIANPSVRPSVTRVDQSKTVERITDIL